MITVDPLDRQDDFDTLLRQTIEPLGGQIADAFGDHRRRLYFQELNAYLDVQPGPGGNPAISMSGGIAHIYDRGRAEMGPRGPTGRIAPTESGWDIFGSLVRESAENAINAVDPARKFSNTISYRLGMHELEEGEGYGMRFLPAGYQDLLSRSAQRQIATTTYLEDVPAQSFAQVYPGMVPISAGREGMIPAVSIMDRAAAAIGGVAHAGGKARQSGIQPYETATVMGARWERMVTGQGLEARGQRSNVMVPLTGSITGTEGQAMVPMGTMLEQRRPVVRPLTGWGTEELSQVAHIRQGALARGGSALDVITGAQGESLFSWQDRHWSSAQIGRAHISLDESFRDTPWYQGLSPEQRGMYRVGAAEGGGGVVVGGQIQPALVMDAILRREAAGSASDKGAGHKAMLRQADFSQVITGGLSEREIASLGVIYEEAPKDPYTFMVSAGSALGILKPGDQLYAGDKLNLPLAQRLAEGLAAHTRTVTTRHEATPEMAGAYLHGKMPGVSGQRWLESGNLEYQMQSQVYFGPQERWIRTEYPAAHSRAGPEQLAHLRSARPELAARVERVGRMPASHVGIAQAQWASYGQISPQSSAMRYEDIQDRVMALNVATSGERGALARAMIEAGLGDEQIIMPGERGMVLPSARHILGTSATDPSGEEVSRLVTTWERAAVSNDPAYISAAAEAMSGKGFVKQLQSRDMPGISGPATAYENIPVGEIRIGESQWGRFARSVYGRTTTKRESQELLATINEQQVLGLTTRYPHSDVYNQNQVFQRLAVGGVGAEEIGLNPMVPAMMRGDTDADQFTWWTTAFERSGGGLLRDAQGRLVVNNRGMGQQLDPMSATGSILSMLEQTDPEAVARARSEVAGLNIRGDNAELMQRGEVIRRSAIFSNEIAKMMGKQFGGTLGASQDDVTQHYLSQLMKIASPSDITEKGARATLSKEFMSRTYPLRRNIAETARAMWGEGEATRTVFSAAAGGYQVALDQGQYVPGSPMGFRGTQDPATGLDRDPEISFGLARWMERAGTQSFLYGGGFLANVTSPYTRRPQSQWTKEGAREYQDTYGPQWIRGGAAGIESALAMQRVGTAQTAMFGAEWTPEQMGTMLTENDPDRAAAVAEKIRAAREWIGSAANRGKSASALFGTAEGLEYSQSIMEAAGLGTNKAMWESSAPMVATDRVQMLMRTANQLRTAEQNKGTAPEFYERVKQQREALESSFQQFTGRGLNEWMDEARQTYGKQELVGGRVYARERTAEAKSQEMARLFPEFAGQNVRDPVSLTTRMNLRASSLGAGEGQLFSSLIQRTHGVEGSWGSVGTKMHEYFTDELRKQLGGENMRAEEQLQFRGTLRSLFGADDDTAFSGKPDVAFRQEGDGYKLLDFKSYRTSEGYDPRQLQVYAAALGEMGYNITGAEYVHLPRAPQGADMEEHTRSLVARYRAGELYTQDVPLAHTQGERRALAGRLTGELSERRGLLEELLPYITKQEAQAFQGAGFKEQIAYGDELLNLAQTRQVLGLRGSDINEARGVQRGVALQSPVQRIGQQYGINLESLGATSARVLDQGAYARAVAELGGDPESGGFTAGGNITVRKPTAQELERSGTSEALLIRRRLAHEGGHALYASSPEIQSQALAQVDAAIAAGSLDRGKLEAQYGENWREMGAREYVAQGVASSAGQLPTYGSQVSRFDVQLSRLGSRALSGGGFSGGEPPDDGPVSFLASPQRPQRGGGGGLFSGMGPEDIGKMLGAMNRVQMGWDQDRTVLGSPVAQRLGLEVAMGNQEALAGAGARQLVEAGEFGTIGALKKFESYMAGRGGAVTGTNLQIAKELSSLAQGSDEMLAGLTGGEFRGGVTHEFAGTATARLRRQVLQENPIEGLREFGKELETTTKRLQDHEKQIVKATENYENLSKEQQKALDMAIRDAAKAVSGEEQLKAMGWQGFAERQRLDQGLGAASRIQAAANKMAQAKANEAYQAISPDFLDRAGSVVGELYHDLTSGWKMMQVNRLWNMTGGRAIGAEQVAMGQEMSVQGALASWRGGGNLGPIAEGLMGIQARQQVAQAGMGRGAYMAYGGVQNLLAGMTGEMAGVGLPAMGAGMIAGTFGATLPVALGVGAAAGLFGLGSYASNLGQDQAELAYKSGGGILAQTAAGLGLIANDVRVGAWRQGGDARALRQQGIVMRSGEIGAFAGDAGAQAVTLRHWAETQATERGVMDSGQWAQMAGQFQAYSPTRITNLNQIPADLLSQAAVRGYTVEGMGGLAQSLGGTTAQFLPLMQSLLAQPNSASMMQALGQYGIAGQMGYVGMDYFTNNLSSLEEMTLPQQRRFNQLMQGDRRMLARYARGENLGLTGTGMDLLQQAFGGPQDWMISTEQYTGLPMHTTTGAAYRGGLGALQTDAARGGGLWGIQGAQFGLQVEDFYARQQYQSNRFQTGYAYQTGQMLPGFPGNVSSGLMGMIQSTGGMWGLQNQQRELNWNYQQQQFDFRQESFDLGNRQWMENWQARWNRQQRQSQWADEDFDNRRAKYAVQDEHWLYNWGMQENKAQLQFGWQMQDLDENIRFATGRDKLRLMRQKERATVSESMRSEQSEEGKEYWEKMTEFRDAELNKAEERHDQQMDWAEEDLERDRKHHDERSQLQQRQMDAAKRHAEELHALEERRIMLERAYWRDQQRAQAEEMQRQRQINEMQLRLRADQMKLMYDQQIMTARFQTAVSSAGLGVTALTTKVQQFNAAVSQVTIPSASSDTSRHSGGPVGMFSTADERYGISSAAVRTDLEQGEYVVPKGGTLVARDERTVDLLTQIRDALREGNGRFTIMVQNPERSISDVTGTLNAAYRS
jgi:hypothetical protein